MNQAREALLRSGLYLDRDLSWLEFNRRVLWEARDPRTPLLERLKFLAIFSMNLDEFFMKRAEWIRAANQASEVSSETIGSKPCNQEQLRAKLLPDLELQASCFQELRTELKAHRIHLLEWNELDPAQVQECREYFRSQVFPILTPLALDPTHPFPFLSNLSTSLGVRLRDPVTGEVCFARLKVPSAVSSWIPLPTKNSDQGFVFVKAHDVVGQNLAEVFVGMEVISVTPFRITRDAEVEQDEDLTDLRLQVQHQLDQRRFEPVVRLELAPNPDTWVRELLKSKFNLNESDVYELPEELDYTGLMRVASLPVPALRDTPWDPVQPLMIPDPEQDLFELIREGDVLVHHPYESFDASVERFVREAAEDPMVRAIKMTVYRVGDDTPFVKSLVRAAQSGKEVVCLVEVRARFDEARNLQWGEQLEAVGAHVVYGVMGLKTHSKVALVMRQEADGLRAYAHIGTGNYHVKTARLYTDLGLFTCDTAITDEVVQLFHALTGRSRKRDYQHLLVAPVVMRSRFLELIQNEIDHAQAGRPSRIIAKMNQLEDPDICEALWRASKAGVPISLIVRGFCCLRPQVAGQTANIEVISVIGRFLEHARVFYFANAQSDPLAGLFFLGSADWMERNLSHRVEVITPVKSLRLKERLWEILQVALTDQRQAWDMSVDSLYVQRRPADEAPPDQIEGSHKILMRLTRPRADVSG